MFYIYEHEVVEIKEESQLELYFYKHQCEYFLPILDEKHILFVSAMELMIS